NKRLLGVAIIAAIGGFLFGYDTGVIGGAMLFMQKDLGLKTHGQQQLTVAILLLGAVTGALISGWLADKISRRRTKMISGSVGCALAQSYWQILAGRFWLGLAVGTASFVSPMYIAELVPPRIRGRRRELQPADGDARHPRRLHRRLGLCAVLEQLAMDVRARRRSGGSARDRDVLHAVLTAMARGEGPRGRRARGSRPIPLRGGRRRRGDRRDQERHRSRGRSARPSREGPTAHAGRRGCTGDLPADRRYQHRHLLRADDPEVRRTAEHGSVDAERLHRLHERLLHDRGHPAPRQAGAPVLSHR